MTMTTAKSSMSATNPALITPDWPAPAHIKAISTTRTGGVSAAPFAALNLGDHVGDDMAFVNANRALLRQHLPAEPLWLKQVHGRFVADAGCATANTEADAAVAHSKNVVCAIMTADCLPVLFCDRAGTAVGAAHAGWRGLADGVLEATVAAMRVEADEILAWFGPAIGPTAFEVGSEVRATFIQHDPQHASAFAPHGEKWLCDLYLLARQRLNRIGVTAIYGGDRCTHSEPEHFFSYRRDGQTGRMASLIWME